MYVLVHVVAIQEIPSQDGKPWTRFVFNSEALLEEEGAAPDGPAEEGKGSAGLGAFDFRPHRSQQIGKPAEDAHEVSNHFFPVHIEKVFQKTSSVLLLYTYRLRFFGSLSEQLQILMAFECFPLATPLALHAIVKAHWGTTTLAECKIS